MPLLVDTGRSGSVGDLRGANCLNIGLVNNMPDAAFSATERQFVELIRAATPDAVVGLKLFSIPEVPRSVEMQAELAGRYRAVAELWDTRLDGLIVTGTEPRAAVLTDEPYWPTLSRLIDWARENTASAVWSCLAAHAAVQRTDGIERRLLSEKLFGMFTGETISEHWLLAGAPTLSMPHSRWNDLPESALADCGYRVLSGSAATGVDAFVREERGPFLSVLFQGHPEYEADSLLREYRRDIGRFLRGERETYPAAPQNYFSDEASALAETFQAHALADCRPDLMAEFPMNALARGLQGTWRRSAVGVYRNWIGYLMDRRAKRRASAFTRRLQHSAAEAPAAG